MTRQNVILLSIVVILAIVPLVIHPTSEFGGADDQVKDVILAGQPNYQPWFASLWQPPSSEVESLLFAVQAALGAGFIGYFIGYFRGRKASMR